MQGERMPIIHSLSIFLLSYLPPFFPLMELAVDQIKKRTFDYHARASLVEVWNLIVILSVYSNLEFGLTTESDANYHRFGDFDF